MKIRSYKNVEPTVFDNDVAKGVAGRVLIGKEDGAGKFCMRFFELQPDGHTPRHTHDWEHEIFIHEGQGSVLREGSWVPVQAGDAVFIPPNEDHQIKNTSKAPLRFVCLIPSGPPEL
ncbi:MAG: cupin domain-containing protein [Desulfacinum sp.]|nr:cupin domain-containing protein [Desulfacinum sp.]